MNEKSLENAVKSKVSHKVIMLDNSKKAQGPASGKRSGANAMGPEEQRFRAHRKMGASERRRKATKGRTSRKYENYVGVHEMWVEYATDALQTAKTPAQTRQALLHADYLGCLLTVVSATCPSHARSTGLVVRETQRTFELIGEDDRSRVVPKAGAVFSFEVSGKEVRLRGDTLLSCRSVSGAPKGGAAGGL